MWKRIGKNGNKYWGSKGAGIFFTDGKKVLLLKRAEKGDAKGSWGLPGGKVEEGETLIDAARREAIEECGKAIGQRFNYLTEVDGQHNWTTFFFSISKPFKCKLSDEHSDWNWFDINKLDEVNLHPKLKENLDRHLSIVEKHFKIKNLNFREWLDYKNLKIQPGFKSDTYKSWVNSKNIQTYKSLSARIDQAYKSHDYKTAEDLEAKLEDLLQKMEDAIDDIEQEGGEEENLDKDYGLQDDMARLYANFLSGNFDKKELIYMLRGALVDVPNLSISAPFYKSSKDTEGIDEDLLVNMAKDAYFNKKTLLDRLRLHRTQNYN